MKKQKSLFFFLNTFPKQLFFSLQIPQMTSPLFQPWLLSFLKKGLNTKLHEGLQFWKNVFNWSCDTFKGKPPLLLFKHTHNAFLWCRWNYIANVHVLRSQFAMQTQEITESPFDSKLISAEQVQGCLKEWKQWFSVQAHFQNNAPLQGFPNL